MALSLPYSQDLTSARPLDKPILRAKEKRQADRLEAAWIRFVHESVFALSAVCAVCGDPEDESRRKGYRHEMNEDPSRAKTRGLPKEQRWNTAISMRICSGCHEAYTRNQVRCLPTTAAGFAGPYLVQRNLGGKTWETLFEVQR